MTKFDDFLNQQFESPEFKKEWDAFDSEFSEIEAAPSPAQQLKGGLFTSERELAIYLLDSVPDYKLCYVIAYMEGLIAGEDQSIVPNSETDS